MTLRIARVSDTPHITALIEKSVWALCRQDYSDAQIERALRGAFGLDTQLVNDSTYFVIEKAGGLVAAGGWSFRQTLFGSDAEASRDPARIDPLRGAAKVRAFFIDPAWARQGLGSQLLLACEQAALHAGFTALELMATLPGQRLYERHGFVAGESTHYDLGDGITIEFVPMKKQLNPN